MDLFGTYYHLIILKKMISYRISTSIFNAAKKSHHDSVHAEHEEHNNLFNSIFSAIKEAKDKADKSKSEKEKKTS